MRLLAWAICAWLAAVAAAASAWVPRVLLHVDFDSVGPDGALSDSRGGAAGALENGAAIAADAKLGAGAARFGGGDERAALPGVDLPTGGGYVACWIKLERLHWEARFLAKATGSGTQDAFFQVSFEGIYETGADGNSRIQRQRLDGDGRAANYWTRIRVKHQHSATCEADEDCTQKYRSEHNPKPGVWEHYVLGYNTRHATIYVDGVELLKTEASGAYIPQTPTDSVMAVGNQPAAASDNRGIEGLLDEFFLFAVDEPDVQEMRPELVAMLMTGGLPTFTTTTMAPPITLPALDTPTPISGPSLPPVEQPEPSSTTTTVADTTVAAGVNGTDGAVEQQARGPRAESAPVAGGIDLGLIIGIAAVVIVVLVVVLALLLRRANNTDSPNSVPSGGTGNAGHSVYTAMEGIGGSTRLGRDNGGSLPGVGGGGGGGGGDVMYGSLENVQGGSSEGSAYTTMVTADNGADNMYGGAAMLAPPGAAGSVYNGAAMTGDEPQVAYTTWEG